MPVKIDGQMLHEGDRVELVQSCVGVSPENGLDWVHDVWDKVSSCLYWSQQG
jgi:hypothetical protein